MPKLLNGLVADKFSAISVFEFLLCARHYGKMQIFINYIAYSKNDLAILRQINNCITKQKILINLNKLY